MASPTDQPRCVAPCGDVCGEAATWSADDGRLYWVDINSFLLRWLDTATGAVHTRQFAEPAVALSLTTEPGQLLVVLASRVVVHDLASGANEDIGAPLPDSPAARFNDGRCDPRGTLLVGSMGNNVDAQGRGCPHGKDLGKLFRHRAGGALEELEARIGIANTVCWSPDGNTLYFGDSERDEIRSYPYDLETSAPGTGQPWFTDFGRGVPDGSAVDEEGCLWNCRYGGGCVVRVTPAGEVDRVVEMPVSNITTCTFGGEGLRTLYLTTASARDPDSGRLAGGVFAFEPGMAGLPENRFALA